MINSLATPGGQLLGLYFLVLVACVLAGFDHQTGTHLLDLIIGAILRDMQDARSGIHTNGQ